MTVEDMQESRKMLQELLDLDHSLTDWEMDFIDSLSEWNGDFTEKQVECLEKIYNKRM